MGISPMILGQMVGNSYRFFDRQFKGATPAICGRVMGGSWAAGERQYPKER